MERMRENTGVLLTDYQGLTVAEISELRSKLRSLKCEYKVIKNTLSKIALEKMGLNDFAKNFEGPTAVAFEKGDPVSAAKVIVDFTKEHAKLKIKAGMLGEKLLSIDDIKSLASLPSREVLLARLLGSMQSSVSGFVNVLAGVPRKFVYGLEAIRKQKEAVKV